MGFIMISKSCVSWQNIAGSGKHGWCWERENEVDLSVVSCLWKPRRRHSLLEDKLKSGDIRWFLCTLKHDFHVLLRLPVAERSSYRYALRATQTPLPQTMPGSWTSWQAYRLIARLKDDLHVEARDLESKHGLTAITFRARTQSSWKKRSMKRTDA